MRERPSEIILNVTLALAAVLFAGLLARREFLTPSARGLQLDERKATFIAGWETLGSRARTIGPLRAPIRLVEFVDYECPFCSQFEQRRSRLFERYPGQVSISFLHFPLPGHRFARLAASAADCAANLGRFEQMHDALFRNQRSIGLMGWGELARDAGIPDTVAFNACVRSDSGSSGVEADLELARALSVRGTPTLIINGWMLSWPPSEDELARIADTLLSGQPWHPAERRDTVSLKQLRARLRATSPWGSYGVYAGAAGATRGASI